MIKIKLLNNEIIPVIEAIESTEEIAIIIHQRETTDGCPSIRGPRTLIINDEDTSINTDFLNILQITNQSIFDRLLPMVPHSESYLYDLMSTREENCKPTQLNHANVPVYLWHEMSAGARRFAEKLHSTGFRLIYTTTNTGDEGELAESVDFIILIDGRAHTIRFV